MTCTLAPPFIKTFVVAIGEKLHAEQEPDNAVDEFAMKVVKNNKTVGHLPRKFCGTLSHVSK